MGYELRKELAAFIHDAVEAARNGTATDARMQAMVFVANTLLWDEHRRGSDNSGAGGPALDGGQEMARFIADKVDERLAELKELGVFDRPTS